MLKKNLCCVRVFILLMPLFSSGCAALIVGDVTQGGYSVSQRDISLINAVEQKLQADTSLRNHPLTAHSVDGNVSLYGKVSSHFLETRAIQVTKSVSGVRKVVSKITVTSP